MFGKPNQTLTTMTAGNSAPQEKTKQISQKALSTRSAIGSDVVPHGVPLLNNIKHLTHTATCPSPAPLTPAPAPPLPTTAPHQICRTTASPHSPRHPPHLHLGLCHGLHLRTPPSPPLSKAAENHRCRRRAQE